MKSRTGTLLVVVGIAVVAACSHLAGIRGSGVGEKPLLLLENSPPDQQAQGADNSRCFVCHLNFSEEKLAVTHARHGIGCEQCHGECNAHCGDENNITPPDKMYAKTTINSMCMECHDRADLEHKKQHRLVFAGKSEKKYCTDCHGKHRLAHRTRRWDKKTGKLIADDGVRMMGEGAPK